MSRKPPRVPNYIGPDTSRRTDKLTRAEIKNRFDKEVASLYSQRDPVWLPDFRRLFALVPRLVDPFFDKDGLVLDIGAGTGNLSRFVLEAIPGAKAVLLDFSANMLSAAPTVLAGFEGRFQMIAADFMEHDLGAGLYAAVISSFAIHHCRGEQEYQRLYERILRSLQQPGIFVCCDVVAGSDARMSELNEDEWKAFLIEQGLASAEIERIFSNYHVEDSPLPLWSHLSLMKEAGFGSVDVAWKRANFAVYAGVAGRPDSA